MLTQEGPILKSGVTWRVYSANGHKLLGMHRDAMPTIALKPGSYFINAAYGLSNLTRKIEVKGESTGDEIFVLNTGGLKLIAETMDDHVIQRDIHFKIQSDEQDQFGRRRTVLNDVKPGKVIRLNAGAYHIISTYGDANAAVRADVTVQPGKLTIATMRHAAAQVTLKLVQTAGGEALADTQWTVLTPTGDVVTKGAGALPTHILAAGDYAVVARHDGLSYSRKFTVNADKPEQVEVVMQDGPASPEVLKEITNPTATGTTDDASAAALGFSGAAKPHSGPGGFVNPGALLHDSEH